jgi:hypothetical protein
MYRLTASQETEAKLQLCREDRGSRCDATLSEVESRFLNAFPHRTKQHRYLTCIILCRTCHDDYDGSRRWLVNLADWELLSMAKDRSCYELQVS